MGDPPVPAMVVVVVVVVVVVLASFPKTPSASPAIDPKPSSFPVLASSSSRGLVVSFRFLVSSFPHPKDEIFIVNEDWSRSNVLVLFLG